MSEALFLTRVRAETILNISIDGNPQQVWTGETVTLFQNTLTKYLAIEDRNQRLTILDAVGTVILATLYSISHGVPSNTITTDLLVCLFGVLRHLFNSGDAATVAIENFPSSILTYLVSEGVILVFYKELGDKLMCYLLDIAMGISNYVSSADFTNLMPYFRVLFITLLSSNSKEGKVSLMTWTIRAASQRVAPFCTLTSRADRQYYEFLVYILSAFYLYPYQLLEAVNSQISMSCAELEAKLGGLDIEKVPPGPESLNFTESQIDQNAMPTLDPFLFLILEGGFLYFRRTESDAERIIVINFIRSYTQHFFTLWIPFMLDLDLKDAEIGLLYCSTFLERYLYMHNLILFGDRTKEAAFHIEKNFFNIHQIVPKFYIDPRTFFIFNSNYAQMQYIKLLASKQDTAGDPEDANLETQLFGNVAKLDMKLLDDNTSISSLSELSYNPEPLSIILPHSTTSSNPTHVLGDIIYSVILISLMSHIPEIRKRALHTFEDLLWSINYNLVAPVSGKSSRNSGVKQYANDFNNLLMPLIKDRFLDSCEHVRETAITVFSTFYRSLLEYLDYMEAHKNEPEFEQSTTFINFLENLDELVEIHVYVKPVKSQLPVMESPAALTANANMISFSLVQRLNDKSLRVRNVTVNALQSLYISGYHRLATPLIQYTYKFGLEGEIELIKLFHIHTHLSLSAVLHRILTFFDSAGLSDFTLFIRMLARQKLLKKLVKNTYTLLSTRKRNSVFIKKQWDDSITSLYGCDQSPNVQTYFEGFYNYMCDTALTKSLSEFLEEGETLLEVIYSNPPKFKERRTANTDSFSSSRGLKVEDALEHLTITQCLENKWLFLHIFSFPFCQEKFLHKLVKLTSMSYFNAYMEKKKETELLQSSPLTCALLLRSILITYPYLFVTNRSLCIKFFFNVFEETRHSTVLISSSPASDRKQRRNSSHSTSTCQSIGAQRKLITSRFIEFSENLGLGSLTSKNIDSNTPQDEVYKEGELCDSDLATPSSEYTVSVASDVIISPSLAKSVNTNKNIQQQPGFQDQVLRISLVIIGVHIAILLNEAVYISETQLMALFNISDELGEICTSTLIDVASTAFTLASSDYYACIVTRNLLFKHVTSCPWTILALYSTFNEWDVTGGCSINYRHGIYISLLRRLCTACNIVSDDAWNTAWPSPVLLKTKSINSNESCAIDLATDKQRADLTQNSIAIGIYEQILEAANNAYLSTEDMPATDVANLLEKTQSLLAVFPEFEDKSKHDPISSFSDLLLADVDTGSEMLIHATFLKRFLKEVDRINVLLPIIAYGSQFYANSTNTTQCLKLISYYNIMIEKILFPFTIEVNNDLDTAQVVQRVSPILMYDLLPIGTRLTVFPIFKLLEAIHTILTFQLRTDQRTLQLQTSYTLFMMITAAHYGFLFTYPLDSASLDSSARIIIPMTLFGNRSMQKAILHGISSTTLRVLLTCIYFGNMPPRLLGTIIVAFATYIVGYCELDPLLVITDDDDALVLNSVNDETGVIISINKPYLLHRNLKSSVSDGPGKSLAASTASSSAVLTDIMPVSVAVKQAPLSGSIELLRRLISKLINTSLQYMEQFSISFMTRQETDQKARIVLLSGRPEYAIFIILHIVHTYVLNIACSMASQHKISVLDAAKYLVEQKNGITIFIDTTILLFLDILLHAATNLSTFKPNTVSQSEKSPPEISPPHFTIAVLYMCLLKSTSYISRQPKEDTKTLDAVSLFLYQTILSIFIYRVKNFSTYDNILPISLSFQLPDGIFLKIADNHNLLSKNDLHTFKTNLSQGIFEYVPSHVKNRPVMFKPGPELLNNLVRTAQIPKNKLITPTPSTSTRETPKRRVRA